MKTEMKMMNGAAIGVKERIRDCDRRMCDTFTNAAETITIREYIKRMDNFVHIMGVAGSVDRYSDHQIRQMSLDDLEAVVQELDFLRQNCFNAAALA